MPEKLSYRYLKASPSDLKSESGKRSLAVCFSSETPVLRGDFYEVLSHDPQHADISMLQRGAFLDEHRFDRQPGGIKKAWIDQDRKGRAVLTFADTELGNERYRLMADGLRNDISVGYQLTKVISQSRHADGKPIKRFAWKAHEISSVAVGADHFGTGVGRSQIKTNSNNSTRKTIMPHKDQTEFISLQRQFSHEYPHLENEIKLLTSRALLEETPRLAYKNAIWELVSKNPGKKNVMMPMGNHDLGMSRAEVGKFSFHRAVKNAAENGGQLKNCFEADVSQQVEKNSGTRAEGFYVPTDVLLNFDRRSFQKRDLTVGDFASGGAAVNPDMPFATIELLRNRMICGRLGARYLGGLQGPLNMPRQISAATAQVLSEIQTVQDSQLQLDQLILTPHRVGATTTYGKQLVFQSSPDIEAVIRDDLLNVIAIKHDSLLLAGQGAGDEPLGIINTPGVNAVNFGGAATFAKMVAFETALGKMNADQGSLAYATSPGAKGIWKATAVALTGATTVSSRSIWENAAFGDGGNDGSVNSYRAASTNQIPLDKVIYGNWNELIYGNWGGWDMVLDVYTKAKNAEIVLTVNTWIDGGLRHAQSFAVSSDSGAQ